MPSEELAVPRCVSPEGEGTGFVGWSQDGSHSCRKPGGQAGG